MDKAKYFAIECHKDQVRRASGLPYITHVFNVYSMVLQDDELDPYYCLDAAMLHDVVEDCGVSLDTIKNMFGKDVARIVDELTNKYEKKDYPDLNRRQRHKLENERLANASFQAKRIKIYDRFDNVKDLILYEAHSDFANVYKRETIDLMDKIGDANPQYRDLIIDLLNENITYAKSYQVFDRE